MWVPNLFPRGRRRFVRIPPRKIFANLYNYFDSILEAHILECDNQKLAISCRIGGFFGPKFLVMVMPEDSSSTVETQIKYKRLFLALIATTLLSVCLSITFLSIIPLLLILLLLPLVQRTNKVATKYLGEIMGSLHHLEAEYFRLNLQELKKKWMKHPKDVKKLYDKLVKKYLKTWGNINILEYKISEYVKLGLTREEAIRKTAEEEGIN